MPEIAEARIRLSDEGEGWPAELLDREIVGTVLSIAVGPGRSGAAETGQLQWHVVQPDDVLEIQERGGNSPSGYRLVRYSHLIVARRWGGGLDGGDPRSCFVKFIREGDRLPGTTEEVNAVPLRLWAVYRIQYVAGPNT